jgi:pimeloyl-ACP methyl ester carboxylesterase
MTDFVITTRDVKGPKARAVFTDEPGPAVFLVVPEDGAMAPGQAIRRDDWVRRVSDACGRKPDPTGVDRGDVLVFIHGYNNSTDIVLQRHRRLKADLPKHGFNGAVVSFDWPSGTVALAYLEDRLKAKMTAYSLVRDCIELFARLQGATDCTINVHILAHSTGAYVVREAFDDADDHAIAAINWTVSQIAFIGGDVSAASFSSGNAESESVYRHCVRLTNYSNPFDGVLQLSNVKRAGFAPRVGRVGLPPDAPTKSVNVECGSYWQAMRLTRPDADIIGDPSHSWHIGDPVFTEDLAQTLKGDLDRSAISTRAKAPAGGFRLVSPQMLATAGDQVV